MTPDTAIVLSTLAIAVALFVTERVAIDVVALMVLGALAVTGLVTPAEALAGFGNPAVVTVWAMFVISGGLSRAGVAEMLSHQVRRVGGRREVQLVAAIMVTAGVLSAVMNNVGVAALMLPVVMDIARRTGSSPSKLLMPLAFGCLLGGLTTLVGTPPNLLVSDALAERGLRPFALFDFTPIGVAVMLSGVVYMLVAGRHLLPDRDLNEESTGPHRTDLANLYDLSNRIVVLRLPEGSAVAGRTLSESRLGAALGLNVIAVIRDGATRLAPDPQSELRAGDRLLVKGHPDSLDDACSQGLLEVGDRELSVEQLVSPDFDFARATLPRRSSLVGRTLAELDFRRRYGVNVLAVERDGVARRTGLRDLALDAADALLIQGARASIDRLRSSPELELSRSDGKEAFRLDDRLAAVHIPAGSAIAGRTLEESRLGRAFGLTVLGISRDGTTRLMPGPAERLEAGDMLLVEGNPNDLVALERLSELELDRDAPAGAGVLAGDEVGLVEAVLSPRAALAGKTLRELHFREKYGLSVLAVWRAGEVYHHGLRDMVLRFGDALLLHGPREKLKMLGSESDFVVLSEGNQEPARREKAAVAALVLAGVLVPALFGWLHISIAAVVGATLMVLSRCLTIEEAYRFIEWRAVVLIAGMLPLGVAMERTGAATLLAESILGAVGGLGPRVVLAALFVVTALAAQVMPTAAVAVLMAPIALNAAAALDLSPHALVMTVAMSASASFMSPVTHPANVMIMGPGGYRFADYVKVGLPLTLVALAVVLVVLPILWPLRP